MLSDAHGPSASALPALNLLNHRVTVVPTSTASGVLDGHQPDVVLLDGRSDLIIVRNLAQLLTANKEFELLKYLAQHIGQVFTRAQLLSDVWGYDYYGGTRTVDVHVRRLRAKLGADHEHLITTVRNVGYSFTKIRDQQD